MSLSKLLLSHGRVVRFVFAVWWSVMVPLLVLSPLLGFVLAGEPAFFCE